MSKSNGTTLDHPDPASDPKPSGFNEAFRRFSAGAASAVGSKWAFVVAACVCLVWAATGPVFHFSETWQLVINTGTTIVTFLMVFLIQNTQNRDAKAMHLKLDELIRGVKGARTRLVNLEEFSDEELEQLRKQFADVQAEASDKVDDAHRKAHEAHSKSEEAKEVARRARDTAEEAKEVAEDAHEDVERVMRSKR